MSDSELLRLKLRVEVPTRLDQALLEVLRKETGSSVSRAQFKRYLKETPIEVNGARPNPSTLIAVGNYDILLPDWKKFETSLRELKPAEHCFIPILYEDGDLLIFHKPSGIPSVSLSGDQTNSASAAALAHMPSLADVREFKPMEPGLLHRLDTGTSGVLAFAKSLEEFNRLKALWKTPTVRKIYRAIVETRTPPKIQTLRHQIGHLENSSKRMTVVDGKNSEIRGKPLDAVTHIRGVHPLAHSRFELEIEIETGVMHQIRVHLAHAGFPILGDKIYGGAVADRLMLQAWRLELPLKNGASLLLESKRDF